VTTAIRQDATGEAIDQHIRRTVEQLRRWSFDTTDSGDGRSKFATGADDEGTLKMPHVFCAVQPDKLLAEADRLERLLRVEAQSRGRVKDYPWRIEATYWPANACAMLQLFDLDDDWWGQ
jgi:hypothetical protein